MAGLTVSMMGMKRNISGAFDALIELLNESDRTGTFGDEFISVEIDSLKTALNNLCAGVLTLCYTYVEDEENPEYFPVYEWEPERLAEEEHEEEDEDE